MCRILKTSLGCHWHYGQAEWAQCQLLISGPLFHTKPKVSPSTTPPPDPQEPARWPEGALTDVEWPLLGPLSRWRRGFHTDLRVLSTAPTARSLPQTHCCSVDVCVHACHLSPYWPLLVRAAVNKRHTSGTFWKGKLQMLDRRQRSHITRSDASFSFFIVVCAY